jgi:transcriptional regulator with XRE-family HTH domain
VTAQLSLFGPELRRRRQEAGLSLSQLAEHTHYSKSYLSKVETGRKPAGATLARLCDVALNAGGELSALVQAAPPGRAAPDPTDDSEVWVVSLAADGAGGFLPMRRRDVLSLGAAGFLGIGFQTRATSAAARDESALIAFRAMFDQSRKLGQLTSPGAVLPSVITMTQALRGMASAAGSDTRNGLLLLAGRCAEYAGWMSQEAGDDKAAGWWTDRATELAGAAGDGDLAAYTLIRQAEIMLYRDDAHQTIALARAAQSHLGTAPRVRGLAAQREAQGHALAGDYDSCNRLLDRAATLLAADQRESVTNPTLGSSTVPNLDQVIRGWCLYDLGRPGEAADILDRELPLIANSARRARARFGIRHALAHADAGHTDEACSLTDALLDTVDLVDSATIRLDLRRLARTLVRRHHHPRVRELYPRLTATLHRTGE